VSAGSGLNAVLVMFIETTEPSFSRSGSTALTSPASLPPIRISWPLRITGASPGSRTSIS
jgi:hypothetical protein